MSSLSASKTGLGKNLDDTTSLTRELDEFYDTATIATDKVTTHEKLLKIINRYDIEYHDIFHKHHHIVFSVNKNNVYLSANLWGKLIGTYILDEIVIEDAEKIRELISNADITDDMKELLLWPSIVWRDPNSAILRYTD